MKVSWILTVVLVLHAHNCFCKLTHDYKHSYEVESHGNYGNAYKDSYDGHGYKSYKDEHYDSYNSHDSNSHVGYAHNVDDRSYGHSYPSYKTHSYDSKSHGGYIRKEDHSYGGHSYPSYKSHSYKHSLKSYEEPSYESHGYGAHAVPHSYTGYSGKDYRDGHSYNEYSHTSPRSNRRYSPKSYDPHYEHHSYDTHAVPHSYTGYSDKDYKDGHSYSGYSRISYVPQYEHRSYDTHTEPRTVPHSYTGYSGKGNRVGQSLPLREISNAIGEIVDSSRDVVRSLAGSAHRKIEAASDGIKAVSRTIKDGIRGVQDKRNAAVGATIRGVSHGFVDAAAVIADRSLKIKDDVVSALTQDSKLQTRNGTHFQLDSTPVVTSEMAEKDMVEEGASTVALVEAEGSVGGEEENQKRQGLCHDGSFVDHGCDYDYYDD